MGCNTSKDTATIQPADLNEQKDNNENEATKNEENVGKIKDEKPPSARTITIKSASNSKPNSASSEGATNEKDQAEAATKIQAAFRGHQSRKTMKQEDKSTSKTKSAQEHHQLKDELPPDDAELSNAATKIQASFRGHMVRKQIDKGEGQEGHESHPSAAEELDIDLTDPELNKAATKIQASFRGHAVRKEQGTDEGAK